MMRLMRRPFAPVFGFALAFSFGALGFGCKAKDGEVCRCASDCRDGLVCVVEGSKVLAPGECSANLAIGYCTTDDTVPDDDDGLGDPPIFDDMPSKRDLPVDETGDEFGDGDGDATGDGDGDATGDGDGDATGDGDGDATGDGDGDATGDGDGDGDATGDGDGDATGDGDGDGDATGDGDGDGDATGDGDGDGGGDGDGEP